MRRKLDRAGKTVNMDSRIGRNDGTKCGALPSVGRLTRKTQRALSLQATHSDDDPR